MFVISGGRGVYLRSFDPITGRAAWTADKSRAKTWATRAEAVKMLCDGERVEPVSATYAPGAGMPQRGVWTDD